MTFYPFRSVTMPASRRFQPVFVAATTELVGLQLDIILAGGTLATATLQRETRTIPIVFTNVTDPVASSLVERLDRPSGNITGFANFEATLGQVA